MKRNIVLSLLMCATFLLESCDIDESGNATVTPFGLVVIIFAIVGFVILGLRTEQDKKDANEILTKKGTSRDAFKSVGMYAGGHPSINDSKKYVYAFKEGDSISLYTEEVPDVSLPKKIEGSEMLIESITDIKVEDSTTVERRITLGRMLLVGVFAFAWKKKKKDESAFVTITWSKGKFEQNTTFMFEGKNAYMRANVARNNLINMCS